MSGTVGPREPLYWDPNDLNREMDRVFEICHSCRRCFNLCPSFPALFDAVDARPDEVAGLSSEDKRRVVDLCYQCKLCDPNCPYTPPHPWMVDFPRLMLRARVVNARREGVRLQDRLLGRTDLMGRAGRALAPLLNRLARNRVARGLLEKTLGVHRDFRLPVYHAETFSAWWRRLQKARDSGRLPRPALRPEAIGGVALFVTCSVDYNGPQTGRDAVAVLEHNGVEVIVPELRCCGMPAMDGGDADFAFAAADANVAGLVALVERGYTVVAPGPTCSYTLRREYPFWSGDPGAGAVAAATRDLAEFLTDLHRRGELRTDFQARGPDRIAYHLPCHLKAQNIGFRSRDLLRLIGSGVEMIDRCSGVDGTWGMKRRHYDAGLKVAAPLLRELGEPGHRPVATDCPLAGLRLGAAGHAPLHPVSFLRAAYGLPEDLASPAVPAP